MSRIFVLDFSLFCSTLNYMTKKKSPVKRSYDHPLQVRVTAELLELFQSAADKDGRSVSGWARNRLEIAAKNELRVSESK